MLPPKQQLEHWLRQGKISQKEYDWGIHHLSQAEQSPKLTNDCRVQGHTIRITAHAVLKSVILHCLDCGKALIEPQWYE